MLKAGDTVTLEQLLKGNGFPIYSTTGIGRTIFSLQPPPPAAAKNLYWQLATETSAVSYPLGKYTVISIGRPWTRNLNVGQV